MSRKHSHRLKASSDGNIVPRIFIYSGKAAPGYKTAKDIIALINSVADIINGLSSILRETDKYMVLAAYADYVTCQERVSSVYLNPEDWTKESIINVASMGKFSSDRTIKEYAEEIWGVQKRNCIPNRS